MRIQAPHVLSNAAAAREARGADAPDANPPGLVV